jgi:hypothetical protein
MIVPTDGSGSAPLNWLKDEFVPAEKPLGSLGQSVRLKELKTARVIYIVIGLLTIGANIFTYSEMPAMVDAQITKELVPLQGQGMTIDPVAVAELRASAIRASQLAAIGFIAIGAIYLVFAAIVEKYPVPITISGLVIYIASTAIMAIFEPMSLVQGIIIKVLFVVGLLKAVQAALSYERSRKELETAPAVDIATA